MAGARARGPAPRELRGCGGRPLHPPRPRFARATVTQSSGPGLRGAESSAAVRARPAAGPTLRVGDNSGSSAFPPGQTIHIPGLGEASGPAPGRGARPPPRASQAPEPGSESGSSRGEGASGARTEGAGRVASPARPSASPTPGRSWRGRAGAALGSALRALRLHLQGAGRARPPRQKVGLGGLGWWRPRGRPGAAEAVPGEGRRNFGRPEGFTAVEAGTRGAHKAFVPPVRAAGGRESGMRSASLRRQRANRPTLKSTARADEGG